MMRPHELRIGNWITVMGSIPTQVTAHYLYMMETYTPVDPEDEADYKEMTNPVPLTEEWLLKFGFKDTTKEWQTDKCFRIVSKAGTKFDYWLNEQALYRNEDNFLTHVYDVHQLQNLYFCLTGKELELTPSTV